MPVVTPVAQGQASAADIKFPGHADRLEFTAVVQERVTEFLDLEQIVRSSDPVSASVGATGA